LKEEISNNHLKHPKIKAHDNLPPLNLPQDLKVVSRPSLQTNALQKKVTVQNISPAVVTQVPALNSNSSTNNSINCNDKQPVLKDEPPTKSGNCTYNNVERHKENDTVPDTELNLLLRADFDALENILGPTKEKPNGMLEEDYKSQLLSELDSLESSLKNFCNRCWRLFGISESCIV